MTKENYLVTGMTGKLNLKEYVEEKRKTKKSPPCEKCRYDPKGEEPLGVRCVERHINHAGYYCSNFERKGVKFLVK